MLSPNCMEIFALLSGSGMIFFIWHMWRFDNFRCLIPTRHDWFRALICYLMLLSTAAFLTYSLIEMIVLYDQYFATIKGITLPKQWQTWPEASQDLWRASLYILAVGWGIMQSTHLEETLYWGYLISTIRSPGSKNVSWVRSIYFKAWVSGSIASLVIIIGAVCIERKDLDIMRAYVFLVGSAMSVVFTMFSTALCFVFPSFVGTIRSQGASYDIIDRLAFFSEMNGIRTVFRWLFTICFLTLSADTFTSSKTLYNSPFASDIFFMVGMVSVLIVSCLSMILLLPRNMTAEALPPSATPAKMRMVAYPRPRSHNPAPHSGSKGGNSPADQMAILGQRLNVDREAMGGMTEDLLEMPPVPSIKAPAYSDGDMESTTGTDGYKASQSEENIFGHQMEDGDSGKIRTPKRGVRWSEAPSDRLRAEVPTLPMSPQRPSQVWIHTETVEKEEKI